jgi:hypothetical protein
MVVLQDQSRKKVSKTPSQKASQVIYVCDSSYMGGIGRKIAVQGWPGQKV